MEIKTVFSHEAEDFDTRVNAALADGYLLTRRISNRPEGWIAEMVKPDEPEERPGPTPWEALQYIKDICQSVPMTDCNANGCPLYEWCEQLRHGGDPTDWDLSGLEGAPT